MPWWAWIGGGVGIFAIIVAIFWRSRNAKWVAELAWSFVAMAVNAFLPAIAKRMPPEDEAELNALRARGATNEEIAAWQRKRLRKKRQKPPK